MTPERARDIADAVNDLLRPLAVGAAVGGVAGALLDRSGVVGSLLGGVAVGMVLMLVAVNSWAAILTLRGALGKGPER